MFTLLTLFTLAQNTPPPQMQRMTLPHEAMGSTPSRVPEFGRKSPFPIPLANRNTPPKEAQRNAQ